MYRLLHIEADPAAHRAVLLALANGPLPFTVEQVPELAALAPPAGAAAVDALLLGAGGPGVPLEALGRCREWFPSQPIIVLTAAQDLGFARAALRAGAQDVVQRNERALAVLSRILLYAIERAGAEMRGKQAEAEARSLRALVDMLFAQSSEAFLLTDPVGTIERATPAAAALLGLALPPPPGAHLAEWLGPEDRSRLATFLGPAAPPGAAGFGFTGGSETRVLELDRIALPVASAGGRRLLRLGELAAAFAHDDGVAADPPSRPVAAPAHPPAPSRLAPDAPASTACTRAGTAGQAPAGRQAAADPGGEPLPATGPTTSALQQLRATAEIAQWHVTPTTGGSQGFGFLGCDRASAQVLQRLAATAREDFDFALAFDSLRLKGWRAVVASGGPGLPPQLVLEVSYGTVASRPHFERLLAELEAAPPGLAGRFVLALQGVPKGIYVPTLAKAIRAMGASHGKPALQLPDLDTDYRSLVLGQLTLLIVAVDDLKRALARDAKQVAAFLARSRVEGCRTIVRGATGALADALRGRLGIDMTVAA